MDCWEWARWPRARLRRPWRCWWWAGMRLAVAMARAGRNAVERLRTKAPAETAGDEGLDVFLLVWMAVPILFFSISRSKLPGYILPSIPAAALLTADYLHQAKALHRTLTALH